MLHVLAEDLKDTSPKSNACAREAAPTRLNSINRFHVDARFSDMVIHGNTIYLAGQVPSEGVEGMVGQTADLLSTFHRC